MTKRKRFKDENDTCDRRSRVYRLNFILYLLEKNKDCMVINLDALTYAGNPENLRPVENDPRYLL